MTYSIMDIKQECVAIHSLAIANKCFCNLDAVVDSVYNWLQSNGVIAPTKTELTSFLLRRKYSKMRLVEGYLTMLESKDAGWILKYEKEQPSGFQVLRVSESKFEDYLFTSAKEKSFNCPFRS